MPSRLHDLNLLRGLLHPRIQKSAGQPLTHFSVLSRPPPTYPGHIPLTLPERTLLAAGSALTAFLNPHRADMIAVLAETTSSPFFLRRLRDRMLLHPTGRRILRIRPRITSQTLRVDELLRLPASSLGHTYARWLAREGVSPDTRDVVRYVDDEEEAYVLQRYRECHDFYHAVTGLPVFVEGEIALKALEFANTGLPMTGLSVLAGLKLKGKQRRRLWDTYLPWAFGNGLRAGDLLCVFWEEELETDVTMLRERLGIETPPDLRELRKKAKVGKKPDMQESENDPGMESRLSNTPGL